MTRKDEIEQTKELYKPWLDAIQNRITSLQYELHMWQMSKGKFARLVAFTIRMKIRYKTRQFQQMKADLDRALSRIP